jgi:hypothetical protein
MQISEAEKKMVERLRKKKNTFMHIRAGLLFSGVFSIGVGVFCSVMCLRWFQLDSGLTGITGLTTAMIAFFMPGAYLFVMMGTWILTDTLINWNGKPEVDLLLRVIEDAQDKQPCP